MTKLPFTDIRRIIPQTDPIVLVHRLVEYADHTITTEFDVPQNHLLVVDGYLSEAGLIENMAQTAACKAGWMAMINGVDVPRGYIGAIKNFQLFQLPKTGSTINTIVRITAEVIGVTLAEALILSGNNKVASCEMKIFIEKK